MRIGLLSRPQVGAEAVAGVVAKWTGIPVSKMSTDQSTQLLDLEEHLHSRVVGPRGGSTQLAHSVAR